MSARPEEFVASWELVARRGRVSPQRQVALENDLAR